MNIGRTAPPPRLQPESFLTILAMSNVLRENPIRAHDTTRLAQAVADCRLNCLSLRWRGLLSVRVFARQSSSGSTEASAVVDDSKKAPNRI
jgi:hypothetical protein